MDEQTQSPPVTPTEVQPVTQQPLQPHRGVLILIFGILSIVCCFIFGIIAWVLANGDLKQMASGRMDPSGEGMTKAGKICAIVGIAIQIVGFVIWLIVAFLVGASAVVVQ